MEFTIRQATVEDVPSVARLIENVFCAYVAPDFSVEGVEEFKRYIQPNKMISRLEDHLLIIAFYETLPAGVIEIRNYDHVSLLFVDPAFQMKNCARSLFNTAMNICRQNKPDLNMVTVNSSPFAIPVYTRLGFITNGEEKVINGIRFTPMKWIPA